MLHTLYRSSRSSSSSSSAYSCRHIVHSCRLRIHPLIVHHHHHYRRDIAALRHYSNTSNSNSSGGVMEEKEKDDWVKKHFDMRYDLEKEFPTPGSYVKKARRYVDFNSDVQVERALERIYDVEERNMLRYRSNRILLYGLIAALVVVVVWGEWKHITEGILTQEDVKEITGKTYRERREAAQFGPQTEETFEIIAKKLEKREKGGGIVPPLAQHRMEKYGETFGKNDFRTLTGDTGVLNASYGKLFTFDSDPQREHFHGRMEAMKERERARLQRLKEEELANDPEERRRQEQMGYYERVPLWAK